MLSQSRGSDAIEMADTEDTDETKTGDQYHPGMFVVGFWCYAHICLKGLGFIFILQVHVGRLPRVRVG